MDGIKGVDGIKEVDCIKEVDGMKEVCMASRNWSKLKKSMKKNFYSM